ncbi:MAG: PH domain-containing protein [Clostridiales Family XIII bacterium]|jgi:hypothetical protein|nr:PH domain-containing protein [Clostridiales Family XIII bacterium]
MEKPTVKIADDGLTLSTLFDTVCVPWADVTGIAFADYVVTVQARDGAYTLEKLGRDAEPVYAQLLTAYCDKVRKALFVTGEAALTAKGDVDGVRGVRVEVHEGCILSLPPDLSARRVPLCFATGFSDADFQARVSVVDGTGVTYAKLGYDHAPFVKAVTDAIVKLREKTAGQIQEIDPSLSGAQTARLAKLLPEGAAAPVGALRDIAPSFVDALEARLAQSRAAETYAALKALCDPEQIAVGFRKQDAAAAAGGLPDGLAEAIPEGLTGGLGGGLAGAIPEGLTGGLAALTGGAAEADAASAPADPYALWFIAPARSGHACAVEFAGADTEAAATFLYRFDVPWDAFRLKLNMALEAIAFKREIIRLTDEELKAPENADYRMANDRSEAVRFVRSSFAGRAIHRGMDSWKQQLQPIMG